MGSAVGREYTRINCEVAPLIDVGECLGLKQQACFDITRRQQRTQDLRVLSGRSDYMVESTITWLARLL